MVVRLLMTFTNLQVFSYNFLDNVRVYWVTPRTVSHKLKHFGFSRKFRLLLNTQIINKLF